MKDRTLTLIIGVLVGAIISTACFLIIKPDFSTSDETFDMQNMPGRDGFNRPEMPNGEERNVGIYGEVPPEKPDDFLEAPQIPDNN